MSRQYSCAQIIPPVQSYLIYVRIFVIQIHSFISDLDSNLFMVVDQELYFCLVSVLYYEKIGIP